MRIARVIQTGMIVGVLSIGLSQGLSAAEQMRDQDERGRQVTLKPISVSRVGDEGGNDGLLGFALTGTILLGVGGLVTAKLIG